MQTHKLPYEFLVRWGTDGTLSGAHIQYRYITTGPDGLPLGEFISPPEPVSAEGYPLETILTPEQIAAFRSRV
ncbi:MAG: hypothetical protein JHC88_00015 [Niveispirillum sp.]|uniref:hypothetical protein n=1 Tax=Asticcacaulis sp. TaxID=1872648 RepID=UPI001A356DE3|nr:hypothetical protein [Asticcacaulis sp.]MBJ7413852.1 hypothetical protein [Niveispirillum sp.]